jgi:lysozyme
MEMKTSNSGIAMIEQHEGFRSTVYLDVAGNPTIGYGHMLKPGETFPHGVTQEQATALLRADLADAEHAVNTFVTVPLTQNQFDALVDWTYNLGAGSLQESTLLELLNKGDYAGVPAQMLRWDQADGKVVPGLLARRQDEAKLWAE